jgi:hypothetical protein
MKLDGKTTYQTNFSTKQDPQQKAIVGGKSEL